MDDTTHSPNAVPEMAPAFKKFLDDALPNDGGSYTLALGECHNETAHLEWLHKHLPELQTQYGIKTIGLELDTWFNIFLWAYKDGTLDKELGTHEKARAYLSAILMSLSKDYSHTAHARTNILMAAMDAGIRVVAYDCRETLPMAQRDKAAQTSDFKQKHEELCLKRGQPLTKFFHALRTNSNSLDSLCSGDKNELDAWRLNEIGWLCERHPEYHKQLTTIEHLVNLGHQKIHAGKLTSDALSASLFDTMAAQGARLTISGEAHINGFGHYASLRPNDHPDHVSGTFGLHLLAVGQSPNVQCHHKVTHAVMGTTATAHMINAYSAEDFPLRTFHAVGGHTVPLLNLDTGRIEETWQPPPEHERVAPLTEKFSEPNPTIMSWIQPELRDGYRKHRIDRHINPLLMPDIKAAADNVRAMMNPEQAQGRPR